MFILAKYLVKTLMKTSTNAFTYSIAIGITNYITCYLLILYSGNQNVLDAFYKYIFYIIGADLFMCFLLTETNMNDIIADVTVDSDTSSESEEDTEEDAENTQTVDDIQMNGDVMEPITSEEMISTN